MPELLKAAIGSVVRFALSSVAGWMISKGVLTPEQVDYLIAGIATGVIALVWSLWAKYRGRLKLAVALESPANSSLEYVHDVIANRSASANLSAASGLTR